MKNKTEAYSVQVDKALLEKAKDLVNLPEAFRALVAKLTKTKTCPCCGAKVKD